jgi:hypothetical protein
VRSRAAAAGAVILAAAVGAVILAAAVGPVILAAAVSAVILVAAVSAAVLAVGSAIILVAGSAIILVALVLPVGISAEGLATALGFTDLGPITAAMAAMAAATSSRPMATLGSANETGLCKKMKHSLREPIENRHVEGASFPVTKTIYLFRCGDSGLYALTADSSGSALPSRIYPQIRWRFERLVTMRTDSNSLKQKIVQAILDSIAKEGFKLIHASVNPELYATLR